VEAHRAPPICHDIDRKIAFLVDVAIPVSSWHPDRAVCAVTVTVTLHFIALNLDCRDVSVGSS